MVIVNNCSVSCPIFHCPTGQSGDFSDGAGHDSVQLSSRLSESSDDSFHSTVEHIDISVSWLPKCVSFPDHSVSYPDHSVSYPDHCSVSFPDHQLELRTWEWDEEIVLLFSEVVKSSSLVCSSPTPSTITREHCKGVIYIAVNIVVNTVNVLLEMLVWEPRRSMTPSTRPSWAQ